MASKFITIDGAMLEGGGQILRNAAALSCLMREPICVNNIRAGRSKPGLRPQHLSGLQLIRDLCGGKLEGEQVGSTEITLSPGHVSGGNFIADTKTAGSICLLLQAALPCLLYGSRPSELNLRGGTNAEMAPQIDYFTWVFGPIAEQFGVTFDCDIIRRGYFPKGGGEVVIKARPVNHLTAVKLTDPGHVTSVSGRAFVAGVLPIKVAQIMAHTAQQVIQSQYGDIPVHIDAVKEPNNKAVGTGTGIIVMAETSTGCRLAGSALGKRGVAAEKVGQSAAEMLLNNLQYNVCVDEYLQDQLIILMALAQGKSEVQTGPVTLHTQTAIHIAEHLTQAKFTVEQLKKDINLITCEGIGLVNEHVGS